MITLTQDNGGCNGFQKRTVRISEEKLASELRQFFGWRKYVTYARLMREGSHNYDRFIKYLSEKGYTQI